MSEIKYVKFGYRLFCRINFNIRKVEMVTGVNSQIDEKTHFLMWDFDDTSIEKVKASLKTAQVVFNLPDIHIVKTKDNGYHAYCFKGCNLYEAQGIIASTMYTDRHFVAAGISRGYFTLRYTDVKGRNFEYVCTLPGKVEADLSYSDVNCFVEYSKAVK